MDNEKRKKREAKMIGWIQQWILAGGEFMIYMYVGFVSTWIAVSAVLWLYARNAVLFKTAFEIGIGSLVIYGFSMFAILIFVIFFATGLFGIAGLKAKWRLEKKGLKKKKSLFEKAME